MNYRMCIDYLHSIQTNILIVQILKSYTQNHSSEIDHRGCQIETVLLIFSAAISQNFGRNFTGCHYVTTMRYCIVFFTRLYTTCSILYFAQCLHKKTNPLERPTFLQSKISAFFTTASLLHHFNILVTNSFFRSEKMFFFVSIINYYMNKIMQIT